MISWGVTDAWCYTQWCAVLTGASPSLTHTLICVPCVDALHQEITLCFKFYFYAANNVQLWLIFHWKNKSNNTKKQSHDTVVPLPTDWQHSTVLTQTLLMPSPETCHPSHLRQQSLFVLLKSIHHCKVHNPCSNTVLNYRPLVLKATWLQTLWWSVSALVRASLGWKSLELQGRPRQSFQTKSHFKIISRKGR